MEIETRDSKKRIYILNDELIKIHFSDLDYLELFIRCHTLLQNERINLPKVQRIDRETYDIFLDNLGTENYNDKMIKQAIDQIKKIQQIKSDGLPFLSKDSFLKEAEIFSKYYVKDDDTLDFFIYIKNIVEDLFKDELKVCHTDFQSTNLLVKNDKLYVIDFQDLALGPKYYDLASILTDCNIRNKIAIEYLPFFEPKIDSDLFRKMCLLRLIRSSLWRTREYYENGNMFVSRELDNIFKMLNSLNCLYINPPRFINTIILGAGKGTRMKTDIPKVLTVYNGKPFIKYVIEQAESINSDNILIVIGYKASEVKAYLDTLNNKKIKTVHQEELLGTGHAILQCRDKFSRYHGDILVLMGDAPRIPHSSIKKLVEYHLLQNNVCSLLTKKINTHSKSYARVVRDKNSKLLDIVEYSDIKDNYIKSITETTTGVSIIKGEYLEKYINNLTNNNSKGEYYLTEVFKMLIRDGEKMSVYCDLDIPEIHSINSQDELKRSM